MKSGLMGIILLSLVGTQAISGTFEELNEKIKPFESKEKGEEISSLIRHIKKLKKNIHENPFDKKEYESFIATVITGLENYNELRAIKKDLFDRTDFSDEQSKQAQEWHDQLFRKGPYKAFSTWMDKKMLRRSESEAPDPQELLTNLQLWQDNRKTFEKKVHGIPVVQLAQNDTIFLEKFAKKDLDGIQKCISSSSHIVEKFLKDNIQEIFQVLRAEGQPLLAHAEDGYWQAIKSMDHSLAPLLTYVPALKPYLKGADLRHKAEGQMAELTYCQTHDPQKLIALNNYYYNYRYGSLKSNITNNLEEGFIHWASFQKDKQLLESLLDLSFFNENKEFFNLENRKISFSAVKWTVFSEIFEPFQYDQENDPSLFRSLQNIESDEVTHLHVSGKEQVSISLNNLQFLWITDFQDLDDLGQIKALFGSQRLKKIILSPWDPAHIDNPKRHIIDTLMAYTQCLELRNGEKLLSNEDFNALCLEAKDQKTIISFNDKSLDEDMKKKIDDGDYPWVFYNFKSHLKPPQLDTDKGHPSPILSALHQCQLEEANS